MNVQNVSRINMCLEKYQETFDAKLEEFNHL